ncbi:biotin/lipoate--protein ligase family protein [Sulfitobacter sp. S190]|uniref:biotin/lipoate--protein ligase family protein n=1 Tax=Sulfitobacter sp. S190 TaxID=2867022 RepID=UPI0021A8FC2F|nr:biotin/lipoate--protein ligase family protein [Sulfitobacter sp. S190]
MTGPLVFPPLFHGEPVSEDAMTQACMRATQGCDAGLVVYALGANTLEAAIVFAPEVPLSKAIAMLPICGIGFQNALGALAPAGKWPCTCNGTAPIRINGARCGRLTAAAAQATPDAVPDWLVIGLYLPLWPTDSRDAAAPHPI